MHNLENTSRAKNKSLRQLTQTYWPPTNPNPNAGGQLIRSHFVAVS